jgi:NAD(P)-dependent dehydrogenase (short-subunit alcohol dehydrogenase family)
VTGASSGIGRAAAVEIGRAGGTVLLVARTTARLEDTAREIEAGMAPDLKRHTPPLPAVARTSPDTPTALKGPLSVPQRTTSTTPMSIDDVKQIGRPTGATVNDVALAAPRRQFCAEVY